MTLLNNRYQILRVLGSGGFGKTFLAEDTQMPSGKRCVIKQLIPVINNPQLYQLIQERFQKEAAVLEELGDHNTQIPRLYAYFSEGGEFYLIQEYIEGQTLSEKLQEQGLFNEVTVKEILINILEILEYVHGKGIVHRDIKPENIILRFSDNKPVLIDFGAVKVTMNTEMSPSANSSQSIVIGTPGFMPMEQIAGRPLFASDLYSLGLTVICLLTGKIPQDLPTDPNMGNILWRHFVPYLNVNFGDILDKAISYNPRDRYLNAREMLTALQTLSNPVAPAFVPTPAVIPVPSPLSIENTIAVSPGNDAQNSYQSNQNTARGGIILASIIASGLIGASIIIGFAINTNTSPINTTNATTKNYFWISQRRVTETDLVGKDGYELDIMRNTVFAVKGRRFDTPGLQEYFNQQSWYNPRYSPKQFPMSLLSKLEQQNVEYIAKYQDRNNLRYFKK